MKRTLIALVLLFTPFAAFATTSQTINLSAPYTWTGLQTFSAGFIDNASSTFTVSPIISPLATPAGTFVAANASGQLIATSSPTGTSYWTALGNNIYNNNTGNVGVASSTPWGILSVNAATSSYLTTPSFVVASTTLTNFITETTSDSSSSAITYDNSMAETLASSASYTTSGTNRYLLVGVGVQSSSPSCSVTYAGTSMTQLTSIAGNVSSDVELYLFGLANPASGSNTIQTSSCNGTVFLVADSFDGAQQTTPVEASNVASAGSGSPSVSVTTLTNGDWVAGWFRAPNNLTAGSNTTLRSCGGSSTCAADTGTAQTPAGSHTIAASQTSAAWTALAVAIKPVAGTVSLGVSTGIGTSTPSATLSISSAITQASELISQIIGGTTYTVEELDQVGHLFTGGPTPTCGTGCSSVTGDDRTMRITTGSSVTSVVVNFANAWSESPICIPSEESLGDDGMGASTTATTLTITLVSALTTKYIGVLCQSSNNFTY